MGSPRRIGAALLVASGAVLVTLGASSLPPSSQPAAARGTAPTPLAKPAMAQVPPMELKHRRLTSVTVTPELVEFASARLADRSPMDKPEPVGLRIGALDVAAPIVATGAHPDGEMEVPAAVDAVAWYRHGPAPGQAGSAVLAAHVDLAGWGPGVFAALRALERGDDIVVDFADGSALHFEVVDGAVYHKSELDSTRIFAREGPPLLTLITCGGGFNPSLARYDSNVVVYAVPTVGGGRLPS